MGAALEHPPETPPTTNLNLVITEVITRALLCVPGTESIQNTHPRDPQILMSSCKPGTSVSQGPTQAKL